MQGKTVRLMIYQFQELLRTRRPFYFIKYQETSLSERLKKRQEEQKLKIRNATIREANALLDKIKWNIQKKNTRNALELAEKLKDFCDTTPKKYLPQRDEYLTSVYTLVGQAYLDLKRLNTSQYEWDQRKRIYSMLGMNISREPSQDSVLKQFKGMFVDWKYEFTVSIFNSTFPRFFLLESRLRLRKIAYARRPRLWN